MGQIIITFLKDLLTTLFTNAINEWVGQGEKHK